MVNESFALLSHFWGGKMVEKPSPLGENFSILAICSSLLM